ncbi:MAG: J domain-containing protein [Rhodospirillales bacterium]|nr:J domain-containing protein [Rhodospirillales bacterium]
MTTSARKISYTIPCSTEFRDRVTALADTRRCNVADLARSVLFLLPKAKVGGVPDPGDPDPTDRETTILKSGPSEGRPWRRKPRLQVRLPAGYEVPEVRRALNLALYLSRNERDIYVTDPDQEKIEKQSADKDARDEIERLRAIISVLSFEPLSGGVKSRTDALHVLGFAPAKIPRRDEVRARFRILATVHHPDSNYGDHQRMSQLNAAMEILNLKASSHLS